MCTWLHRDDPISWPPKLLFPEVQGHQNQTAEIARKEVDVNHKSGIGAPFLVWYVTLRLVINQS